MDTGGRTGLPNCGSSIMDGCAGLTPEQMSAPCVQEYEAISELASKPARSPTCIGAPIPRTRRAARCMQRVTERSSRLEPGAGLVDLEWANAPDDVAQKLIESPELAHYRHFLEKGRLYRPHC